MIKNKEKIADKAVEVVQTEQKKADQIAQAKMKMTKALDKSAKKEDEPAKNVTKAAVVQAPVKVANTSSSS